MAKFNLSAPWVSYYHQIQAMFGPDPEIHIIYDEDEQELELYVDDELKAEALSELLPTEKTWGETTLKITIYPANELEGKFRQIHPKLLYTYAFEGNSNYGYCIHIDTIFANGITYIVFTNKVIQYYNDNLGDVHGLTSVLAQDLAKELFNTPEGVYYCTDVPEEGTREVKLGMWP